MDFSERYINKHRIKKLYLNESVKYGYTSFDSSCHWTDHIIEKNLVFSHRTNEYTKKTFTEGLHVHNYYELVIYVDGNINYITDSHIANPKPYSVIWFKPEQMHTATLLSASKYERYVFYFSDDFFVLNDTKVPMTNFMNCQNSNMFTPDISQTNEIKSILNKIDAHIKSDNFYSGLLVKALIVELFAIFNDADIVVEKHVLSTDFCMEIKNYIDTEYASILTLSDISEKFHYSREHISRKFKDAFNISISDYIAKRRVLESLPLLNEMLTSRAAYEVGFKSQSAYISAFVKNMGCLPSEYKKYSK